MIPQDDVIQQVILQAALRLYRKSGFTKITMDNLAKATGRSRSSLYYYFKNRDEVFQAVLNRVAEDVANEIQLSVVAAETLNDKIYAFCFTKIKTSQDWKRVFNSIDKLMGADEQSKHLQYLDGLHHKLFYLERNILMELFSVESLTIARKPTNAELDMLAFLISSGVRGIRREVYDHNDPHNPSAAVRLLSDMITKWLKA